MRHFIIALSCLMLVACCSNSHNNRVKENYSSRMIETDYVPSRGKVFHAAGFDIEEGQQMRDFFDDFEEPMHTYYSGNNVDWTYYVDYAPVDDEGKIVRYCELDDYKGKKLCRLKVTFDHTYVSNATSDCR